MARWPRSSEPAIITAEMRAAEDNPSSRQQYPRHAATAKGMAAKLAAKEKNTTHKQVVR